MKWSVRESGVKRKIMRFKIVMAFLLAWISFYPATGFCESNGVGVHGYNVGYILDEIKFQTDVDRAKFLTDKDGISYMRVEGVGDVYNPSGVAVFTASYNGEDFYYGVLRKRDEKVFRSGLKWLEKNLIPLWNGKKVWLYKFDNTYNDVFIKAPWYSSFAQATGIEAFLSAYRTYNDRKYLNLAKEAAEVLFVKLKDGGLLFERGGDIWFEEIPAPQENPPHILNAQLRTLIALDKLYGATGEKRYKDYFDRGFGTLKRWLPLYDTGYWLRYDLNPKKMEILLRFNNPYRFKLHPLAIDKISIVDPSTGVKKELDAGNDTDFEDGFIKLSGIGWQQKTTDGDITLRKLKSDKPAAFKEEFDDQGLTPPHTYVIFKLPSKWDDNLRVRPLYLDVIYKDEARANINVQVRAISDGVKFADIPGGELFLTGSGGYRTWRIPIYPNLLGYYVGLSYAEKHYRYLEYLCGKTKDEMICRWKGVAYGYVNQKQFKLDKYRKKESPVVQPERAGLMIAGIKVKPFFKMYSGHDFDRVLASTGGDYVAGLEGQPLPYVFDILIPPGTAPLHSMVVAWESGANSARDYSVELFNGDERVLHKKIDGNAKITNTVKFDDKKADRIRVTINSFNGQQRLLLREIGVFVGD